MKRISIVFVYFSAIAFVLVSCKKSDGPEPASGSLSDIKITLESELKCNPGDDIAVALSTASSATPLSSDKVVLRSADETIDDVVCNIKNITKTAFVYTLPAEFIYGQYNFCLRRGTQLKGYGKVTYSAPGSDPVKPDAGKNIYGQITCSGAPVANVVVSDGYEVVLTDERGIYQMKSDKKNPYVFISVPSGYEVTSNGVLPVFHKNLLKSAAAAERVDFQLADAGDQTNHTMLFLGDMHLANRTNDRNQFRTFTSEVNQYVKDHPKDKIYAMTLGDMTWDLFWYDNNYCFAQYLSDINTGIKGLQIFHTIGNHDHDMKAAGDWDTVLKYKESLCPNYYSLNIGRVHYIAIDDIECTNDGSGTDKSRTYNKTVVSDVLTWLKKDLQYVSKDTPVVIVMHAPLYTYNGGNAFSSGAANLISAVSGYNVTFVTGHTHIIYNVDKSSSNIKELNSGAVCAAWWWAGKYNSTFNIGTDGSPCGYRIATVKGTDMTSVFKATGRPADYQFRVYDRNKIRINATDYGVDSSREATLLKEDYGKYQNADASNTVIVNVWDYDPRWKVEMLENGKNLTVKQITTYDPAFLIAYTIPRLKENSGVSWHQSITNHMFSACASSATSTVTIKVTDDEGNVYTQEMKRPLEFKVENYK